MGLLASWATNRAKKEITAFRDVLRGMDEDELTIFVEAAHKVAAGFMIHYQADLYDPFLCFEEHPAIDAALRGQMKNAAVRGNTLGAAAINIWLQTFRGVLYPECRCIVREMWGELARGMSYNSMMPKGFEPIKPEGR